MLSISSGHSAEYLTGQVAVGRESYYTGAVTAGEPPGIWSGRGAEALGLTGTVDPQDMTALYEHRLDPRDDRFQQPAEWGEAPTLGGPLRRYQTAEEAYEKALAAEPDASPERREQLRLNAERTARQNVQFLDATFSVPKSVTVLATGFERRAVQAERAGDAEAAAVWSARKDAVEAAVLAGNRAAIEYLQDKAGYSRVGHHGGQAGRFIDAHDWVVASFLQHDSRDHDPQLHVHNAILNRVQCADGKWRTLHGQALYAHRAAAGALAERVMGEVLVASLPIRFATRPDGKAREVLGVDVELMDALSSRRRAITPKVARLVEQFEQQVGRPPNGLELTRLSQRATLSTRRAKSSDGETADERLDRWAALVQERTGQNLDDCVDAVFAAAAQAAEPEKWLPEAVISTALAEVQAGRAGWRKADLMAAVDRALPDTLGLPDPDDVRELLERLTAAAVDRAEVAQVGGERAEDTPDVPELRLADGRSAYAEPGGPVYALTGQLLAEHTLRAAAVERGAAAADETAAEAAVDRLAAAGLVLGPDQRRALTGVLTSGAKVETLVGPAGTGKSTVVGGLARVWSDPASWSPDGAGGDGDDPRGPRVVGLASSQVATEVLADEGLAARNVTRWLDTQTRLAAGGTHAEDAQWRLSGADLVVVDEAAMLPTADLVAIHEHVAAAGAKLLLTGDHRQLAAVGAGGGMQLLANAGGHELTEVRRFTAEWEGPASLRLRDGDDTVLHDYRKHGRLVDAGTPEQARTSAARAWLADTLAGKQSVLVVGSNEDAARLSAEVRAELVRLGRVAEDGVPLSRDGTTAGVGDLVQARRNGWELAGVDGNTRAPINRETYRVVETRDDGGLVVEHVAGPHAGTRLTLPGAYVAADVTLGYAGTVHSTQGRTVDTSHVVVGAGTSPEAVYVGLSRGREGNHAHVITHPTDDQQPTGAGQQVRRVDPLGVLAGVVRADTGAASAADVGGGASATEQAEADQTRRKSMQTPVERFAAEAELVYTARTAAALDRLAADGVLTAEQRSAFAAEATDTASLARRLRAAELAGHDPDQVLADAVAERDFIGARSLPQTVHGRIAKNLTGQLAPAAESYADMVPAVNRPDWHARLAGLAEQADARRRQLGTQTAEQPPEWALTAFGPPPDEPVARLDWEHRAGVVASWRELAGHTDQDDPLGPAVQPGQPEHYAAWRAAWTALGRPDPDREDAELSTGQLRVRVRAWQREKNWEPAYVGESLTATNLTAQARRRDAHLTAARAAAADDPAAADRLRQEADDHATLADFLDEQAARYEEADRVRGRYLAATAVTRDKHDRAVAELARRGEPVGAEDPDAVTAAEWLAEHRADQAREDPHRQITDEHDLADQVQQRAADTADATPADDLAAAVETAVPDARDQVAESITDEPGRLPTAADDEAVSRRAAAALAEIEQRRQLDQQHAEDERARQLAAWADDDRARAEVDVAAHGAAE
jgi:conjugative relaxase-like TrwC/TraI family protein